MTADAVSAAIIANDAVKNNSSEKSKIKSLEKANKLLPAAFQADLSDGFVNDVKEIIESDTLVPDGEIGIYDSDTCRIILNSKATPGTEECIYPCT